MPLLYKKNRVVQDNSEVFEKWKSESVTKGKRQQEERTELKGRLSFRFFEK